MRRILNLPKVVSDSSPLIHLSKIGLLDILPHIFGEIMVPEAVHDECVIDGGDREDAKMIANSEWIKIKSIDSENDHLKRAFLRDVDDGEAEAIVLAIQESADLILIDEYDARELARNHDIKVTGVIGVLLKAKKEGLVDDIKMHLDELRESGFWIDDKFYDKICNISL